LRGRRAERHAGLPLKVLEKKKLLRKQKREGKRPFVEGESCRTEGKLLPEKNCSSRGKKEGRFAGGGKVGRGI